MRVSSKGFAVRESPAELSGCGVKLQDISARSYGVSMTVLAPTADNISGKRLYLELTMEELDKLMAARAKAVRYNAGDFGEDFKAPTFPPYDPALKHPPLGTDHG